jgi:hypothetical protein
MADWMLTDEQIYDLLNSDDDALEGYTYEGEGGFITTCDVHALLAAQARKLVEDRHSEKPRQLPEEKRE